MLQVKWMSAYCDCNQNDRECEFSTQWISFPNHIMDSRVYDE